MLFQTVDCNDDCPKMETTPLDSEASGMNYYHGNMDCTNHKALRISASLILHAPIQRHLLLVNANVICGCRWYTDLCSQSVFHIIFERNERSRSKNETTKNDFTTAQLLVQSEL